MNQYEAHYNGPQKRGTVTGKSLEDVQKLMKASVEAFDPDWREKTLYYLWNGNHLVSLHDTHE